MDVHADVVDAWLQDAKGERVGNVEQGTPIGLQIVLQARRDLPAPVIGIHVHDELGSTVFGFNRRLTVRDGEEDRVPAGECVRFGGAIENRLTPGRYFVNCYVARSRERGDYALQRIRVLDFVVFGLERSPGAVTVDAEVEAVRVTGSSVPHREAS
jgi:hypothetical protein